jgi:hypothetical protein
LGSPEKTEETEQAAPALVPASQLAHPPMLIAREEKGEIRLEQAAPALVPASQLAHNPMLIAREEKGGIRLGFDTARSSKSPWLFLLGSPEETEETEQSRLWYSSF